MGRVLLLVALLPSVADSHPGLHQRLELSDEALAREASAEGYIRRAHLHAEEGAWADAMGDLDDAEPLAAPADLVDYHRAALLLQHADHLPAPEAEPLCARAKTLLDQVLKQLPDTADARVLRARIALKEGDNATAITDLEHAIAVTATPRPELYLDLAEALVADGRIPQALAALESGYVRLGDPLMLIRRAIELATDSRNYGIALQWHERLPPIVATLPISRLKRGDLLQASGNHADACITWKVAAQQLAALPEHRRRLPLMAEAATQVRERLTELCADTEYTERSSESDSN